MTQTTQAAAAWLNLILNGIPIANIADNASSSPATVLYVSLHTASPGVGGGQNTNEAGYTSYARVSVARNSGSPFWTVSSNTAVPSAPITFPTATGGSETETFMGIGTAISGAGHLEWFGAISPQIVVVSGVPPSLTQATTITAT